MKKHTFYTPTFIFTLILLLSACSAAVDNKVSAASDAPGHESDEVAFAENAKSVSRKVIQQTGYTARVISAIEFLERKGESIDAADKKDLEKEAVVLLELETPDKGKDFFESPAIGYTKEEGMQYLVGDIARDVTLFQGKNEFHASGTSFERSSGQQNKIRVILFFSGVNASEEMRINYYDRLLGAGIINFGINN